MFDKFTIAQNLQRIMREKDFKPRDLKRAIAANGDSITDSSLSNYLSTNAHNVRQPTYPVLLMIAKALKVSINDLLGDSFKRNELNHAGLTSAGLIAVSESLTSSKSLSSFEVKSGECEPFKSGDVLVIDNTQKEISVGHYLLDIGGAETVCKCINTGEAVSVSIGGKDVEISDPTVVGKVILNLTSQF